MRTEVEQLTLAPPAKNPGVGESGHSAANFYGAAA